MHRGICHILGPEPHSTYVTTAPSFARRSRASVPGRRLGNERDRRRFAARARARAGRRVAPPRRAHVGTGVAFLKLLLARDGASRPSKGWAIAPRPSRASRFATTGNRHPCRRHNNGDVGVGRETVTHVVGTTILTLGVGLGCYAFTWFWFDLAGRVFGTWCERRRARVEE
jgi:hypothetical protein